MNYKPNLKEQIYDIIFRELISFNSRDFEIEEEMASIASTLKRPGGVVKIYGTNEVVQALNMFKENPNLEEFYDSIFSTESSNFESANFEVKAEDKRNFFEVRIDGVIEILNNNNDLEH